MQAYMEMFPKEFLAAFGMTGSLADPGVFFTTYIASWLWPIIAAAAALLAGTRSTAVDLDRGFLDLPLSTRLSRTGHLAASIGAQVLVMAILAAAAVLGLWAAGHLVGADFDLARFGIAAVLCFAFGCAIAGPATLCAVLTLSRGMTSAIVGRHARRHVRDVRGHRRLEGLGVDRAAHRLEPLPDDHDHRRGLHPGRGHGAVRGHRDRRAGSRRSSRSAGGTSPPEPDRLDGQRRSRAA